MATDVFRAIADPTRRAILSLLLDRERSVNELRQPFRMTQPAISQHLGVLRRCGLVRSKRAGKGVLYRLDVKPLEEVHQWSAKFVDVKDPFGHVWRLTQKDK